LKFTSDDIQTTPPILKNQLDCGSDQAARSHSSKGRRVMSYSIHYTRRAWRLFATASGLALALAAGAAHATTTIDNAVDNVPGTFPSPLVADNGLIIGASGTGQLNVLSGGQVTTTNCATTVVGQNAGSNGLLVIQGGSVNGGACGIVVGLNGVGSVNITQGGALTTTTGAIGGTGSGQAFLQNAGSSWIMSGDLTVGTAGPAGLEVDSGSLVQDVNVTAASGANTTVHITVDGANSTWVNTGAADFGAGAGSAFDLLISNGGKASDTTANVESGSVSIDGAGASWTNSGDVKAGSGGVTEIIVANGGSFSIGGGTGTLTLGGAAAGAGQLIIGGPGSALGPGAVLAANINLQTAASFIDFNHTSTSYSFDPVITGPGALEIESGTTILTAASGYSGLTSVDGGTLLVNGSIGFTLVAVNSGGSLGGSGRLYDTVTVQSGGTLLGRNDQILVMAGLTLNSGSITDVTLGAPSAIRSFAVLGNLRLDGTLNIHDAGGFGPGLYYIYDYAANLSGPGLTLGTAPAGYSASNLTIQSSVAGEVNLLVGSPTNFAFWNGAQLTPNGAIAGGNGAWNLTTTNWSDAAGAHSGAWAGGMAIFAGATPGIVSVDDTGGAVTATSLQFARDGYSLVGGPLILTGPSPTIRVGDGSAAGAGYTVNVNAPLAGTTGLIKTDLGTLLLTGTSTYTGLTDVQGGALKVNGTLAASVQIDSGSTLTGDGAVLGAVTVANGGILQGHEGVSLQTGALTLNASSIIDAGLGAAGGPQLFVVEGALTLDGQVNITDTGGFGPGVYKLIAYTGALVDHGLTIGTTPAGTPAGSLTVQTNQAQVIDVVYAAGSTLQFWNGAVTSPNGQINGGAGTWKLGSTNWTDANGASSSAWGGVGAVLQGTSGTVTIDNSGGAVTANFIQFASSGFSIGGGTLTLTGVTPTIRVGDGVSATSATISSVIAGPGGLTLTDIGALTLSGANTYTGGTTVLKATLLVGADANLGAASGGVSLASAGELLATSSFTSNRAITFNGPGFIGTDPGVVLTLTGPLSGSGAFSAYGAGEIKLSGASTFTGPTTVTSGTLQVNDVLGGTVTVQSGARLQGIGTVGTTTIASGATLAPGNSIGTLTVIGNVTLAAGSTYEAELNAAGQSDLTHASGTITLQGGAVHALAAAGVYGLGTKYTILTADSGLSGSFGSLNGVLTQPFLKLGLTYDADHAYLNVQRNGVAFCAVAVTKNQCAVANGADSLPPASPVFVAIANSPDAASARVAFDAVSGEVHASTAGVEIEDSHLVRDAALGRLAGPGDGRAVWGQVLDAQGGASSDGNAAGLNRSVAGVLFGVETGAANGWKVGALAGYDQTRVSIGARASGANADDYHLGAYAGRSQGPISLRLGAAYAWHDITANRTEIFTGFAGATHDERRAETGQVFAEAGVPIGSEQHTAEPFVGLALVSQHGRSSSETGGAAALNVAAASSETTFATIGLRGRAEWGMADRMVSLTGALAWRGAYGDVTPRQSLTFAAGGAPFVIDGAPISKSAVVLNADLAVKVSDRTRLSLIYGGQSGQGAHDQSARLNVAIGF
jgi:fibronectin-binding autotransporter adhesin